MAKNARQPMAPSARPVGRPAPRSPYGRPGARPPRRPAPEVPVTKNKKKEKDYFFIMKRGVCFFIMLFAIIWIAVFALSFVKVAPQYTSMFVQPDRTPLDERDDVDTGEVDADGNPIINEYEDKSVYIGMDDVIFGIMAKMTKKEQVDADGNSKSPFYDEIQNEIAKIKGEEAADEKANGSIDDANASPESEAPAVAGPFLAPDGEGGESAVSSEDETAEDPAAPVSGDPRAQAMEQDGMFAFGTVAATYYPIVLLVGALIALILFIIALLSLFGRRIFKGFAILSLLLLVAGVFALIGGMAVAGISDGNPKEDEEGAVTSIVDFSKAGEYLTGAFSSPPATAPMDDEPVSYMKTVAGIPTLVFLAAPAVMLLLSFFTKKKVPYSIFDM